MYRKDFFWFSGDSRLDEELYLIDLRADTAQDMLRVGQELAVIDVINNLGLVQLLCQCIDCFICGRGCPVVG